MKWLFFFIFLGNVGFFAWHQLENRNVSVVKKSIYAPPVSQKVVTLSESLQELNGEGDTAQAPQVEIKDDLETQLEAIVEDANNKRTIRAAVMSESFCPIFEVEKDQDRQLLLAKIRESGWRYRDVELKKNSIKYWLYISAPETKEEATAIIADLKQKNIDSFRITRGEMKNRISLGLYSVEGTAKGEEARIESLVDYPVETFQHERVVSLLKIQFVDKITREQLESLKNWSELNKMMIKLEKNPC
ncbi:SPOR domain-containing protein [Marinomonas sp. 15G1-11]|uniref:SPOR domain-containing protein n=1 Tax=Marinomonas phaeophyticola TaxID=3004091 RepID=A0ABT4JVY8_9GAMM|nr:SPOR domain-containing protein [Marinomonas sp. 15G1-11]MCZ2722527.1 SPOR domain-containing protein [Marinomonas sp. 15G1-11]